MRQKSSVKKKKTTVKKTSSVRKKKATKSNKNFQKMKKQFFEKFGILAFFSLLLVLLMVIIIWRWQNTNFRQEQETGVDYQARVEFVETILPTAQKLQRQYGIFASVSMAQAMLESEFGQSQLASEYHNLFGVKTDASDPNGADFKTLEFENGEWIEITDRFKVYESWADSLEAHAQLLVNGTSWDENFYQAVTDGVTPQEQARGLQQAGYATDPDYADKLIHMMEEWELYQYNQPVQE